MLKATIVQSVQPLFWDLLKRSHEVVITSAYVDDQVVQTLVQEVGKVSRDQLKSVSVVIGLDSRTNSDALRLLLAAAEKPGSVLSVRYAGHHPHAIFHPKLYYFVCIDIIHILIGSGNFTDGGLSKNHEVFCHLECSPHDELALTINAILERWKSGRFSKPLDSDIVRSSTRQQEILNRVSVIAKSIIEHNKELLHLMPEVEATKHEFARLLLGTAGSPVILEAVTDPQAIRLGVLRRILNKGVVVAYDVSVSKLRVHIPPSVVLPNELPPAAADADSFADSQTIVVGVNRSAYVKLLPSDAMKEFEQFRGTVDREIEKFSLTVAGSHYVPHTALNAFFETVRLLRASHKRLLDVYVARASPILSHLREHLTKDVLDILATSTSNGDAGHSTGIITSVKAAADERRKELRRDPSEQLPFSVILSPHPMVTQASEPDHPAWKLLVKKPDRALVDGFVDLLIGQAEAVLTVTQYKQQAALKRQLADMKPLISVRGKTVDRMIRQLQSVAQPTETTTTRTVTQKQNSGKVQKLTKLQFHSSMAQITRSVAKSHIEFLRCLQGKGLDVALDELFTEYELKD